MRLRERVRGFPGSGSKTVVKLLVHVILNMFSCTFIHIKDCTWLFIAALFVIAKPVQSFSVGERLKKTGISIPWNTTQQ